MTGRTLATMVSKALDAAASAAGSSSAPHMEGLSKVLGPIGTAAEGLGDAYDEARLPNDEGDAGKVVASIIG